MFPTDYALSSYTASTEPTAVAPATTSDPFMAMTSTSSSPSPETYTLAALAGSTVFATIDFGSADVTTQADPADSTTGTTNTTETAEATGTTSNNNTMAAQSASPSPAPPPATLSIKSDIDRRVNEIRVFAATVKDNQGLEELADRISDLVEDVNRQLPGWEQASNENDEQLLTTGRNMYAKEGEIRELDLRINLLGHQLMDPDAALTAQQRQEKQTELTRLKSEREEKVEELKAIEAQFTALSAIDNEYRSVFAYTTPYGLLSNNSRMQDDLEQ
ncbi:MAG: hypothetical protein KC474_11795, partial [Cyanobacteria bacterium HKST-UBA04]|nr:hypothetical protein [Cyanobacteria bacterium HKST-UBA04]